MLSSGANWLYVLREHPLSLGLHVHFCNMKGSDVRVSRSPSHPNIPESCQANLGFWNYPGAEGRKKKMSGTETQLSSKTTPRVLLSLAPDLWARPNAWSPLAWTDP